MAITYTVQEKTDESATHSLVGSRSDEVQADATMNYLVEVTDPADSGFDPRDIRVTDVLADATGLPTVGQSIWNFGGKTIPYLACRTMRGRRDVKNRAHFHVETTWSTGGQNSLASPQSPPATLGGYTAREDFRLGEISRTVYEDQDGNACQSPAGSLYSNPFVEQVASKILTITQYESSITYDQMAARAFTLNDDTWQGDAAHEWMIIDIDATDAIVPLSGGDVVAAKVVTTFAHNPNEWKDERYLIDTHYLTTANDLDTRTAFKTADSFGTTFINTNGTLYAGTTPLSESFRIQGEIDFSTYY